MQEAAAEAPELSIPKHSMLYVVAVVCGLGSSVQEAAAEALGSMCADGLILNSVIKEEGLWSVIAMAQSPHGEVQRLAARAFWYLAIHSENKRQVRTRRSLALPILLRSPTEHTCST